MRNIICLLLIIVLFVPTNVKAGYIDAEAACVLEMVSGDIVFSKRADKKMPMASTTKIMTAIVAIENECLDEIVTVSANAANQEGSSAYIEPNDEISIHDLLYGLMLNSGNDAAVAIAEHISGSVEEFSKLMNKKAKDIGAENTHFTNPNGLHDEEHYTTAYDLAQISRYALSNAEFCEIVSANGNTAKVLNTGRVIEYYNHNRLLKEYEGCIGVKTGFTKDAGRCLVSAAERDDLRFIAVTLNDPSDWEDHKIMLNDAFSEYEMVNVTEQGEEVNYLDFPLVYAKTLNVPAKKRESFKTETVLHIPKSVKPPVEYGDKLGYAEIFHDGKIIGKVDVLAGMSVYKETGFKNDAVKRFQRVLSKVLF